MSSSQCPQCGHVSPFAAESCIICGAELTQANQQYSSGHGASHTDDSPPFASVNTFDFGAVFTDTIKVFSKNIWLITKLVFVLFAPLEIFKAVTFGSRDLDLNNPQFEVQTTVGLLVMSLIAQALIAPSVIFALNKVIRTGVAPTLHESYRWGLSRLPKFCLSAVMMWILIAVGTILCIVPGIIAAAGLAAVYPVATLENYGPVATLQRSWDLTEGNRLMIFLLGLVIAILCGIAAFPIQAVTAALVLNETRIWPLEVVAAIAINILNEVTTVLALVTFLHLLSAKKAWQTNDQ